MIIDIWEKERLTIDTLDYKKEILDKFLEDTKYNHDEIGIYSTYGEVMMNPYKNEITNKWVAMTRQ